MRISYNTKPWSTHIPILLKAVNLTDKDVLELGSGPSSTPLLHWVCKYKNSRLYTVEEDKDWFAWANRFHSNQHKIVSIDDMEKLPIKQQWGVVFVDHSAMRRAKDIIRFKNNADYIVIHDTEQGKFYNYDGVWKHFKNIYTWKDCRPWTTVVSNFKTLEEFKKL